MTFRRLLRIELFGASLMAILGSMLHFAFGWSDDWPPLALIAAVNESIWEHLKLAFWPGLFWGAIMPLPVGLRRRDALAAKGVSLLVTSVLIVAVFTSYKALLGDNLLILDIGTFIAAIVAGQLLSAWVLSHRTWQRVAWIGLVLISVQTVAFGIFTFLSPDHWLFIEESSGIRGIPVP